jgi:hypothetical protein
MAIAPKLAAHPSVQVFLELAEDVEGATKRSSVSLPQQESEKFAGVHIRGEYW